MTKGLTLWVCGSKQDRESSRRRWVTHVRERKKELSEFGVRIYLENL